MKDEDALDAQWPHHIKRLILGRQVGKTNMMNAYFQREMHEYAKWLTLPGEQRWTP